MYSRNRGQCLSKRASRRQDKKETGKVLVDSFESRALRVKSLWKTSLSPPDLCTNSQAPFKKEFDSIKEGKEQQQQKKEHNIHPFSRSTRVTDRRPSGVGGGEYSVCCSRQSWQSEIGSGTDRSLAKSNGGRRWTGAVGGGVLDLQATG
ncbi:hypothetical protein CEXT_660051 [Caerostris extrusa]|uniref:Uncharacterized protein n=1 Tax=Caerostris extrusa TaxID=172846 RepID=A0AAV4VE00_CAEEX|nr:hypothetical protein CEXT_660051 [Caerostris extrusa]